MQSFQNCVLFDQTRHLLSFRFALIHHHLHMIQISCKYFDHYTRSIGRNQRRSSRPPNPPFGGGGAQANFGAQVSLKLLFGYVTIFSSADLFTTDLNCRKKLACDIISECNVILSRRI